MQEQVSRQFVGIDLHHPRSVIVRLDQAGKLLGIVRVDNDPVQFALAMAEAGEGPEVALEATYGYYWAADLLKENGAQGCEFPQILTGRKVAPASLMKNRKALVRRFGGRKEPHDD